VRFTVAGFGTWRQTQGTHDTSILSSFVHLTQIAYEIKYNFRKLYGCCYSVETPSLLYNSVLSELLRASVNKPEVNIVTCQRISRQRLDKNTPRYTHATIGRMFIACCQTTVSPQMNWRDSYHVTCFLCGLRYATIELCFLRCPHREDMREYGDGN
jgi:hypothetical protein